KKIGAAIGKENRTGDQDAKNRARGADGGDVVGRFAPQHRDGTHDNVEYAGADSGQKVVAQEAVAAPDQFELAPKRPQHEHVDQDVPDAVDVVQEQIGEGLPDAQSRNHAARHQPEPKIKAVLRLRPVQVVDKNLQEKNRAVGDQKQLHAGRDEELPVHA